MRYEYVYTIQYNTKICIGRSLEHRNDNAKIHYIAMIILKRIILFKENKFDICAECHLQRFSTINGKTSFLSAYERRSHVNSPRRWRKGWIHGIRFG